MFTISEESYLPDGLTLLSKGSLFAAFDREMIFGIRAVADGDPLLLKILVQKDEQNKELSFTTGPIEGNSILMTIKNPHENVPTFTIDRCGFATHSPTNSQLSVRFVINQMLSATWFHFIYEFYREEIDTTQSEGTQTESKEAQP